MTTTIATATTEAAKTATVKVITKIEILCLYRNIIRHSKRLRFTDKDYFLTRVRQEFTTIPPGFDDKMKQIMYEKGLSMYKNKVGGFL